MEHTVETHPLEPFLPEGARLLMLGSFPPPRRRWSMDFYYPNMQNDMWRILGLVFFDDRNYFVAPSGKRFDRGRLETFLREKGIALSDTAHKVVRLQENASDNFLQIVEPVDLRSLLSRIPDCHTVVTTGQKATETLLTLINTPAPVSTLTPAPTLTPAHVSTPISAPPVGGSVEFTYDGRPMRFWRMPSSSRAYPKPLPEKAAVYREMFDSIFV